VSRGQLTCVRLFSICSLQRNVVVSQYHDAAYYCPWVTSSLSRSVLRPSIINCWGVCKLRSCFSPMPTRSAPVVLVLCNRLDAPYRWISNTTTTAAGGRLISTRGNVCCACARYLSCPSVGWRGALIVSICATLCLCNDGDWWELGCQRLFRMNFKRAVGSLFGTGPSAVLLVSLSYVCACGHEADHQKNWPKFKTALPLFH
jgi:hypothetical protein